MSNQLELPSFTSLDDFRAHHEDLDFWAPYIDTVLKQHDLTAVDGEPVAGHNPTYPTFVCGDVVVKFFGGMDQWRKSYEAERAALALVATDPEILASQLLGSGYLFSERDSPWAYLLTGKVPGVAAWRAELTPDQMRSLARQLGEQIERLHAIEPAGVKTHEDWATVDIIEANRLGSLPEHLVSQIEHYVARLGPMDRVFVNSDIVANHIYVEDGQLIGIIDWGDAMASDRHIEIIQIYRDLFECDKSLLKIFLEASNWPITKDFPRKAMGYALHRQATMRAQHHGGDAFEPIAEKFPLDDIATLDELAEVLFDIR